MIQAQLTAAWFGTLYLAARRRVSGTDAERGDVPGWVMITVMSAVLVVAILAVFRPQITDALSGIIDSVSGKK